MSRLPFIPSSYSGRSTAFESQRYVNLYPELATAPNEKGVGMLIGAPGKRLFSSGLSSPVRGAVTLAGVLYAVESNKLVSIDTTGVHTILGTLTTSAGRVSMAENGLLSNGIGGNQIMIVDGAHGYIYNVLTGVFTQQADIPAVQAAALPAISTSPVGAITITAPGSGYDIATPPTATITDATGVGAVLQVNLGYSLAPVVAGTYSEALTGTPVVNISDPTGTGAVITPTVVGGLLVGFVVTAVGSGYTAPVLTVTNATADMTASLDTTAGSIISIDVTNGGSNYTAPLVVISSGTATATAAVSVKTLTAINLINGGSGYISQPIVTITGTGGNATATATAVDGVVTAITITGGSPDYTDNPTVTISTPEGSSFTLTPQHVEYVDGYFIVTDGTMNAFASELYNGLLWNAIATTPIQAVSDSVSNLLNLHEQLFFIKQYTTEVFYNNATPTALGFPFSRMQGAVIDYGTPAPWSVARGNNSAFFLANERDGENPCFVGVVELNGYTPTPITPQSIVYKMSQSTDLTQCFGFCYSDEGHTFYQITNPVDDWTFVYDTTSQMWHERSTNNLIDNDVHRDRANCYVRFNNMHLVGDIHTGNIYELSSKFHTDAGLPITSIQTTQHLNDRESLDDIFIDELQIDIESGVGRSDVISPATAYSAIAGGGVTGINLTYAGADYTTAPAIIFQAVDGNGSGAAAVAGVLHGSIFSITITNAGSGYTTAPKVIFAIQEIEPVAGLSRSKDGGKTWGPESTRSMGKIGEYRKRVLWRSVGRSKDVVFKLRISSPVKRIIMGWYVEGSK